MDDDPVVRAAAHIRNGSTLNTPLRVLRGDTELQLSDGYASHVEGRWAQFVRTSARDLDAVGFTVFDVVKDEKSNLRWPVTVPVHEYNLYLTHLDDGEDTESRDSGPLTMFDVGDTFAGDDGGDAGGYVPLSLVAEKLANIKGPHRAYVFVGNMPRVVGGCACAVSSTASLLEAHALLQDTRRWNRVGAYYSNNPTVFTQSSLTARQTEEFSDRLYGESMMDLDPSRSKEMLWERDESLLELSTLSQKLQLKRFAGDIHEKIPPWWSGNIHTLPVDQQLVRSDVPNSTLVLSDVENNWTAQVAHAFSVPRSMLDDTKRDTVSSLPSSLELAIRNKCVTVNRLLESAYALCGDKTNNEKLNIPQTSNVDITLVLSAYEAGAIPRSLACKLACESLGVRDYKAELKQLEKEVKAEQAAEKKQAATAQRPSAQSQSRQAART